MFSNLAKFRAASAVRAAPRLVVPAHSNDNTKIVHAAVGPHRRGRPILACHWRPTAGGRLECRWQAERAQEASAKEADQRVIAFSRPSGFPHAA
jgi:hypothetical protein